MKTYGRVIYKGEPACILGIMDDGVTAKISIRNGAGGFHYVPTDQLQGAPSEPLPSVTSSTSLSQRTGMDHMVTIVLDRSQLKTLYGIVDELSPTYPNAVALKEMLGRYL